MRDGPDCVFGGGFCRGRYRGIIGGRRGGFGGLFSFSSASGKSSGVASQSGVHSVAPYSFRSATDESVQAIGLAL